MTNRKGKKRISTKIRINKPTPSSKKNCPKGGNIIQSVFKIQKSGDTLIKTRFTIIEKIREKLELSWEDCHQTKVVYHKHPTSTKSRGSALHALLGTVNTLGYFEAESGSRKAVCGFLRKFKFENNPTASNYLRESITAYFLEESRSHPTDRNNNEEATSQTSCLDQLGKLFKTDPHKFDWETALKNKRAIDEYIDILEDSAIPFLMSDLKLVAEVYRKSLKVYLTYKNISKCLPLSGNSEGASEYHVAINEKHEFIRLVPVVKRDMEEIHKERNNVINEVYSLQTENELRKYLEEEHYGLMGLPATYIEDSKLLEMIREVSQNMQSPEERLVVEISLLSWSPMLVQAFHDKLIVEKEHADNHHIFHFIFTKITGCSLRNDNKTLGELLWIICAHPVVDWKKEILIMYARDYFNEVNAGDIKEWRKLVESFPGKLFTNLLQLAETENYFRKEDKKGFLDFLKDINGFDLENKMDFKQLNGVSRVHWLHKLRKLEISSKLSALANARGWNTDSRISQSWNYLHSVYNERAGDQVTGLLGTLQKQSKSYFDTFKKYGNVGKLIPIANQKVYERSDLNRGLRELQDMMESDPNTTLTKDDIEEVVQLVNAVDNVEIPDGILQNLNAGMPAWVKQFKSRTKGNKLTEYTIKQQISVIAIFNHVILKTFGHHLRNTQKFAIVSAICMGASKRNLLSEIATGEGKTFIVLALAIVQGLFREKVDVVTCSGVLAQRDANRYKAIFELFGLSVAEVTSDDQDQRVMAYQSDVVYGELAHFQRDYLLDRFYNQNIRGARKFASVIVDEVDSMFLDKGNSVLYLSHQPPDLDSLEEVFVFVWTHVVRSINSGEYHRKAIQELVLSSIYPTLTIETLLCCAEADQVNCLWEWLVAQKVISRQGRLLGDVEKCRVVLENLPEKFQNLKNRIIHMLKAVADAPGRLKVMNYLKPFVEHHLSAWIKSAFQATQMTDGKEYVVDVNHSKTTLDKNPKVMILDLDTGVDLRDSQWNEGLHQFLQLKHGCKLSLMNLKAVFVSCISFFKKYNQIFGLTGTIGTESDRNFLKSMYKVEFVSVPHAAPKQFEEWEPKVCANLEAWKNTIVEEANGIVQAGRSALVICGTVMDAENLHSFIVNHKTFRPPALELYRRDYEKFQATEDGLELQPGHLLIATNLAGRGTDIKLSGKMKEKGGLHVILSYLPDNLRVEQQAFGRASRCGDPGTARLIVIDTISNGDKNVDPMELKLQRDESEMLRVAALLNYYTNVIKKEEIMFELFRESFEKLTGALDKVYQHIRDHSDDSSKNGANTRKILNGNINEVKELVMYSLLDDWAFWLDRYSTLLASFNESENRAMIDRGHHQFEQNEKALIHEFQEITGRYEDVSLKYEDPSWFQSAFNYLKRSVSRSQEAQVAIEDYALTLIHEPGLLVKVAKCFLRRTEYRRAVLYLNRVCEEEKEHCVSALYYKVLCSLKMKEWKTESFGEMIDCLRRMLEEYRTRQSRYSGMVAEIQYVDTQNILHSDGYRNQKKKVMEIINIYLKSIDDLVGRERILPRDLGGSHNVRVSEHLCQHLAEKGVLLKPQFVHKRDLEKIQRMAEWFDLTKEKLAEVLCLIDGKYIEPETEKILKKELDLPSRSGFWKEITPCLENITEFAVIWGDEHEPKLLKEEGGGACKRNDFNFWARAGSFYISKYGCDMTDTTTNQLILRGTKREWRKQQRFIHLRNKGQLCYEQGGHLNLEKLKMLKLNKFSKVSKATFTLIPGIDLEDSTKIYDILLEYNIIDGEGILRSTEWTKDILKLSKQYEVFRSDILCILQSKCRYQYELLSLLYQYEALHETGADKSIELKIALPSRPWKDFIFSAIEEGFILGMRPNPSYFEAEGISKSFEKVFKQPFEWGEWIGKKTGVLGGPQKAFITREDLKKLFPLERDCQIDRLFQDIKAQDFISPEGEILSEEPDKMKWQLSPDFVYHQAEIVDLVEWHKLQVKENMWKDSLSLLYEAMGKLRNLEEPSGDMVELSSRLTGFLNKQDLTEEVHMFTLSGFDHVIVAAEERYTSEMICSTMVVINIGLVECAIGVWLQYQSAGTANLIAEGFIKEGLNDVMYGLMSYKSGLFSWQDWVDHKWLSIVKTAIAVSFGSWVIKGLSCSKYGMKLFGSSKMGGHVVNETLKTTATLALAQHIAPVMIKRLTSKIVNGCTQAEASMDVNYSYEKALRQFIDHLSSQITFSIQQETESHSSEETLSDLVNQVGIQKAGEIAGKCRSQIISDSLFDVNIRRQLANILTPVLKEVKEATRKMSMTGTLNNQHNTTVVLLALADHLMTTPTVVDALQNMKRCVDLDLHEIDKKVKTEIEMFQPSIDGLQPQEEDSGEKNDFINDFLKSTQMIMRGKIDTLMRCSLNEPLMATGCQTLMLCMTANFRNEATKYQEEGTRKKRGKGILEIKHGVDVPLARKRELQRQVVQLCAVSRDPKVIAHVVEFGGPMGVECLQALANKLGVMIVVDSDNPNVPKAYVSQIDNEFNAVVHLKQTSFSDNPYDVGYWEAKSIGENIRNSMHGQQDSLLDAINKELMELLPHAGNVGRAELAEFIRGDPFSQTFIKDGRHHKYNSGGDFENTKKFEWSEKSETEVAASFKQLEAELREAGQMKNASDVFINPGPIKDIAFETIDGQSVPIYQKGMITIDTVPQENAPQRTGKELKMMTESGCLQLDEEGPISPLHWGAPAERHNLFPNELFMKRGIFGNMERIPVQFIRNNASSNPSVLYDILLIRDSKNIRPNGYIIQISCRTMKDGKAIEKENYVYIFPNERINFSRRACVRHC